jgi:hypothetical protein
MSSSSIAGHAIGIGWMRRRYPNIPATRLPPTRIPSVERGAESLSDLGARCALAGTPLNGPKPSVPCSAPCWHCSRRGGWRELTNARTIRRPRPRSRVHGGPLRRSDRSSKRGTVESTGIFEHPQRRDDTESGSPITRWGHSLVIIWCSYQPCQGDICEQIISASSTHVLAARPCRRSLDRQVRVSLALACLHSP